MSPSDPILPLLERIGACERSRTQYATATFAEAVTSCTAADLVWLGARLGLRREVVGLACDFAERAARPEWGTDHTARVAIDTARRWILGEATPEECRDAANAAAYGAAYAAYAAHAAAYAAYAAHAVHAVDSPASADVAAYDVHSSAIFAAAAIGGNTELAWQAERARKVLTVDVLIAAIHAMEGGAS